MTDVACGNSIGGSEMILRVMANDLAIDLGENKPRKEEDQDQNVNFIIKAMATTIMPDVSLKEMNKVFICLCYEKHCSDELAGE